MARLFIPAQSRLDARCHLFGQHCGPSWREADVGRLVHFSEGAFSRFSRLHMGKTFPEFVNELRIGRACRLLAEGEMNVTEIAFACGFSNLSNFNRQFLRLKKTTPTEFRRDVETHALKSQ